MNEELRECKTLQLSGCYSDALRRFQLDTERTPGNLAWDNVIEIDRNNRRDIVIRIRIIRIGPAASGPGQEKHEAKNEAAQRSMSKQIHSLPIFQ
jgi:hypothetical protein